MARLKDAERVHIWAGTGVSEQLFIAFVVQLMKLVGGDVERLALVPFEKSGNRRVVGLGELDESQMREHPEPQPLDVDVIQHYLNAWGALTSRSTVGTLDAASVHFVDAHSDADTV